MNTENAESCDNKSTTKMEKGVDVLSLCSSSSSSPSSSPSSSSSPPSLSNRPFEVDTRTSGSGSESGVEQLSRSFIDDDTLTSQEVICGGGEEEGRIKGKEAEGEEGSINSVSKDMLLLRLMTQTESPGIQVMDKSAGYEEDRIPASVFARSKSTTPVDWSVASNESLFSIHMGGNTSFTKDRFVVSEDIGKSGEFIIFSPSLAGMGRDEWCNNDDAGAGGGGDGTKNIKEDGDLNSFSPTASSWSSPSSPVSVGATSRNSFAFPILIEERKSSFSRGSPPPSHAGAHVATPCPAKPPSWFSWLSCASCFVCRPNCSKCFC